MSETYIRPLCLYEETCLHKREKTKKCSECWHHENYWIEVSLRDLEKNLIITMKQLHRYKQAIKDVKSLAIHLRGRCGQVVPYEIKEIIQKCEEVND